MPASIRVPKNDYIVLIMKIGKKLNIYKITVFGSEFFDRGNRE